MTWLPISLKNAAKCDKWYQLQNLSITESLNANGARKQTISFNSEHAMISVSNKNQKIKKQILCLASAFFARAPVRWLLCACLCGCDNEQTQSCSLRVSVLCGFAGVRCRVLAHAPPSLISSFIRMLRDSSLVQKSRSALSSLSRGRGGAV